MWVSSVPIFATLPAKLHLIFVLSSFASSTVLVVMLVAVDLHFNLLHYSHTVWSSVMELPWPPVPTTSPWPPVPTSMAACAHETSTVLQHRRSVIGLAFFLNIFYYFLSEDLLVNCSYSVVPNRTLRQFRILLWLTRHNIASYFQVETTIVVGGDEGTPVHCTITLSTAGAPGWRCP